MLARMAVTRLAAAARTFAVSAKYANQLKKAEELVAEEIGRSRYAKARDEAMAVLHHCKGLAKEKQTITERELLTLFRLPLLFDYRDSAYWKMVDELVGAQINSISFHNKLMIMKAMRTFGVHKDSQGFEMLVKHTVTRAAEGLPDDLVQVVTAACACPKAVDAKDWTALETALVAKLESVPWAHLAELIGELPDNRMSRLLEKSKEYMGKNISEVPRTAYKTLLNTYGSLAPEHYPEVSRIIENASLHKLSSFTLRESVDTMLAFANMQSGSPELFAEFEALVGKKLDQLEPADVAPILATFAVQSHTSQVNYEKLFTHFIRKVRACVHQLSMPELALVAESYTLAQTKLRPLYELLSPIIVKRKDEIDENSLVRILFAFTNPCLNPGKHHGIYDALEPTAIKILSASCSPFAMIRVAYGYAAMNKGSEKLVKMMVERIPKAADGMDKVGAMHLLSLAANLKLGDAVTNAAKKAAVKHMKEFDRAELAEVSQMAAGNEQLKEILQYIPKI